MRDTGMDDQLETEQETSADSLPRSKGRRLLSRLSEWPYLVEREPIKPKVFAGFFLAGSLFLFLVFSATIAIPSAHHDQTRHFREYGHDPGFKGNSHNDRQYGWLYLIGRPIAAEIEAAIYRNTYDLSDLSRFRIGVILVLGADIGLLGAFLVALGLSRTVAFCLSAAVFTLPGVQNAVFMTNYPNALAPLLGLISYLLFSVPGGAAGPDGRPWQRRRGMIRTLMAFVALMLGLLTYPALAFFFLVPSLAVILLAEGRSWPRAQRLALRDLVFLGGCAVCYFLMVRVAIYLFLRDIYLERVPAHWQMNLHFGTLVLRMTYLFNHVAVVICNLWNIYSVRLLGIAVGGFVLGALVVKAFFPGSPDGGVSRGKACRFGLAKLLVVLLFFVAANIILLVGPAGYFLLRFVLVGSSLVVLLVFWSGGAWLSLLGRRLQPYRERLMAGWAMILMAAGGLSASYVTTQNVWHSNAELTFVRAILAGHLDAPMVRIPLVRPVDNRLGFNGRPSVGDEFNNRTTDHPQDIADFVRLALIGIADPESFTVFRCDLSQEECVKLRPPGHVLVTQSAPGEPIYESPNMVVVDMTQLMQTTGWSKARLITPESVSTEAERSK